MVDTGEGTSEDVEKCVAKAAANGSKVAAYYAEDADKKVARFFEAM